MTNAKNNLSKGRIIASWILVGLLGAIFILSAIMKLTGGKEVTESLAKYGLEGKQSLIGLGELIAAFLFLIPRTSSLGVLFLSAHIGGIIATHMEHGEIYMPLAFLLVIVWIANWLRNPGMFASFTK